MIAAVADLPFDKPLLAHPGQKEMLKVAECLAVAMSKAELPTQRR
jgi:hypothetical protein